MQRILAIETIEKVGQEVAVAGWVNARRDHGGVIFIDLRDHTGLVQLTINPESVDAFAAADKSRDEFVIKAVGKVLQRQEGLVNPKIATGGIEIAVQSLEILNASKTLPFPIFEEANVNEDLRLRYRFLDLRREKMQRLLRRKDEFITFVRNYMHGRQFTEVTTPILTSSSPEGARDFLVPSRLHPGKFYALPQAPQQFKQLLMIGGLPKYFQIAPCFRDEDARADRSPGEFYQLDMEMSFIKQEDILDLVEDMMTKMVQELFPEKQLKGPYDQS
jgi:aspartyl-tRNA synthetase